MEYMTNQDMIDLAFGVPAHEYNCYSLIGEIAERVAQFNDYNTPRHPIQRYSFNLSMVGNDLSITGLDLIDLSASNIVMCHLKAGVSDALALNEMLNMVIYLAKELTV